MERTLDELIKELQSLNGQARIAQAQHERTVKNLGKRADEVLEELRGQGLKAYGNVTYGFEVKVLIGKSETGG